MGPKRLRHRSALRRGYRRWLGRRYRGTIALGRVAIGFKHLLPSGINRLTIVQILLI